MTLANMGTLVEESAAPAFVSKLVRYITRDSSMTRNSLEVYINIVDKDLKNTSQTHFSWRNVQAEERNVRANWESERDRVK